MWLEDRLPGTVAWRLPLRLRPVIDEDWVEFLRELIRVTCTPVVLDDQAAKEFVERWRQGTHELDPELGHEVSVLEAWLRRRLTNTSRPLGWSHGDFGYGNLLADPASGRLQAVVDWETGRADEMLGVDWMNMLLARERMSSDLIAAVRNVAQHMKAGASADGPARALVSCVATAGLGAEFLDELLGLTLLRIVQREARYPRLFAKSMQEFSAALQAFRTIVDYSR
jgi:hypothetical protein